MTRPTVANLPIIAALFLAAILLGLVGAGAMLRAEPGEASEPSSQAEEPAGALQADEQPDEGLVRVGRLIYAGGKTSKCFAEGFLELADRHMDSNVSRHFQGVELGSEDIFQFPFIVMTGEGRFTLSDDERENLRAYLSRGGFLLASAGCSNEDWAKSFRRVFAELFPQQPLEELSTDHPMFHTLFDIDRIIASKGSSRGALYGMSGNDRLSVVFSPLGLNDTANAGGGCCCCGGNEVRNAKEINANLVAYALTH